MALPKKLLKSISLIPKKILQPRREELLEQIQKDGTYLPKGIYHAGFFKMQQKSPGKILGFFWVYGFGV